MRSVLIYQQFLIAFVADPTASLTGKLIEVARRHRWYRFHAKSAFSYTGMVVIILKLQFARLGLYLDVFRSV